MLGIINRLVIIPYKCESCEKLRLMSIKDKWYDKIINKRTKLLNGHLCKKCSKEYFDGFFDDDYD